MMGKIICLLFTLLLSFTGFSQEDNMAIVLLESGRKVSLKLDVSNDILLEKEIKGIDIERNEEMSFSPLETKRVTLLPSNTSLIPKIIFANNLEKRDTIFLKPIEKGTISFYTYYSGHGVFIETSKVEDLIRLEDNKPIYQGFFASIMSDCPTINNDIPYIRFSEKSISKLVSKYNRKCGEETEIHSDRITLDNVNLFENGAKENDNRERETIIVTLINGEKELLKYVPQSDVSLGKKVVGESLETKKNVVYRPLETEKVTIQPLGITLYPKIVHPNNEEKRDTVYLRVMTEGLINLFTYRDVLAVDRFFVEDSKVGGLLELETKVVKVNIDGKQYEKKQDLYKGVLNNLMNDCGGVEAKIKSMSLDERSLVNLVGYYNTKCNSVDPKSSKSTYVKVIDRWSGILFYGNIGVSNTMIYPIGPTTNLFKGPTAKNNLVLGGQVDFNSGLGNNIFFLEMDFNYARRASTFESQARAYGILFPTASTGGANGGEITIDVLEVIFIPKLHLGLSEKLNAAIGIGLGAGVILTDEDKGFKEIPEKTGSQPLYKEGTFSHEYGYAVTGQVEYKLSDQRSVLGKLMYQNMKMGSGIPASTYGGHYITFTVGYKLGTIYLR